MGRATEPVCKMCRREGKKLFLKGERCFSVKCAVERRGYPPGEHGYEQQYRRQRPTAYGMQFREKQRLRRIYGVLESQFRRYYREAARRTGLTGTNLLVILECRLDNIVHRLGWGASRSQARQLVSHGHFDVNGKRCDIPSALLKPGDVVSVHPTSRSMPYFKQVVETLGQRAVPVWLSFDGVDMTGRMATYPTREEIDVDINEQLVVEYYSR